MSYTILCLPVLLPVLFWAGYHYLKDRHLPEPLSHLLLAFIRDLHALPPGPCP